MTSSNRFTEVILIYYESYYFIEAFVRRRELSNNYDNNPNEQIESTSPKFLLHQGSLRNGPSTNEPIKTTNQILSPHRNFTKMPSGISDDMSTFKTPSEFGHDIHNSSHLSGLSITDSAQKHLNYSRATISFRQVRYLSFPIFWNLEHLFRQDTSLNFCLVPAPYLQPSPDQSVTFSRV